MKDMDDSSNSIPGEFAENLEKAFHAVCLKQFNSVSLDRFELVADLLNAVREEAIKSTSTQMFGRVPKTITARHRVFEGWTPWKSARV